MTIHSITAENTDRPKVVDRARGAFLNQDVTAWENLQRLASGWKCPPWSQATVSSFIVDARSLIGCCIAGDTNGEEITADQFTKVVDEALARLNQSPRSR